MTDADRESLYRMLAPNQEAAMPSAAEERRQAVDDIQRIAEAFSEEFRAVERERTSTDPWVWEELAPGLRASACLALSRMLTKDIIRVGKRPESSGPPMTGQTTIDDEPGIHWREDSHVGAVAIWAESVEGFPCAVCGYAGTCGEPPGEDCHS
ncbi:MAG: hypothetical protein NVS3B1_12600 [Marmoricola sp.]